MERDADEVRAAVTVSNWAILALPARPSAQFIRNCSASSGVTHRTNTMPHEQGTVSSTAIPRGLLLPRLGASAPRSYTTALAGHSAGIERPYHIPDRTVAFEGLSC
jgi:hypothetical protein